MGANAVIGVDFDYLTFSNNMIGVVANGTAVNIEKISWFLKQSALVYIILSKTLFFSVGIEMNQL